MKRIFAVIALVVGLVAFWMLGHVRAEGEDVRSETELKLMIELQNVKAQLLQARTIAAGCDAGWAQTRTQFARTIIANETNDDATARTALDAAAKAAGFEVTTGLDGSLMLSKPVVPSQVVPAAGVVEVPAASLKEKEK